MKAPLSPRRQAALGLSGVVLAAVGRGLAEIHGVVEWHRLSFFPHVAAILQTVSGWSTSTIGEVIAAYLIIVAIVSSIRRRARVVGPLMFAAGVIIFGFYASWGVAYHYPPLADRLAAVGPPAADSNAATAQLDLVAERSVQLIKRLSAGRAASRSSSETRLAEINRGLIDGYSRLPAAIEASPVGGIAFGPMKLSRVSFALSHLQISGYYFPWSGEAQINAEMPDTLWPRVGAHEKAHQRGFARENEATVMGVLACLESTDGETQYSGALGLFVSLDHDLARLKSPDRKRIWALLPPTAIEELRKEAEFWNAFEGVAGRVSEKVNDTYLKAQGVPTGIRSYSETTRLFMQAIETKTLRLAARLDLK